MKTVALFGGSFNPPHPGHFDMAAYIQDTLKVDELWLLYSVNWQKDEADYASIEHRLAMGELLNKYYPEQDFVLSDIQENLGTHITYEVLQELSARFPDTRFIWVMGADSLLSFNTWENYEDIIQNYPIAIVDRPPYTEQAKASFTALTYQHLETTDPSDLSSSKQGWCFLNNPLINMSSSDMLKALRNGQTKFEGHFQDVADYILEHGILGVDKVLPHLKQSTPPQNDHH